MDLQSQSTNAVSIYLQIAAMLEDHILREILLEGEQVPSTNELSRAYQINPATAAKGIRLLVEEGIIFKKRGRGMFVAEGAREKVRQKRADAFYAEFVTPLVKEAVGLNLGKEEIESMIQKAIVECEK